MGVRASLREELAGLPAIVAKGGGAGAQRAVYEIAGIEAVARWLTEVTRAAE